MQDSLPEGWVNLGVDVARAATPERYQPGIGLRPGGERPDLEPVVARMVRALYASVAAHARLGLDVVVDIGHHERYSRPLGTLRIAVEELSGLPVLFVGVRCPVAEVRRRRRDTWGDEGAQAGPRGCDAATLWEEAVHEVGRYDVEVDTSVLDPLACARAIAARSEAGGPSVLVEEGVSSR